MTHEPEKSEVDTMSQRSCLTHHGEESFHTDHHKSSTFYTHILMILQKMKK